MRAFIYNTCYVHYRKMRIMRETERKNEGPSTDFCITHKT